MDYFHLLKRGTSITANSGNEVEECDLSGVAEETSFGKKPHSKVFPKLNYFSIKGLEGMIKDNSILDRSEQSEKDVGKGFGDADQNTTNLEESLFTSGKGNKAKVSGKNVPKALDSFSDLKNSNYNNHILDNLRTAKISRPTIVQKHVIPVLMQRRDLIVRSATGSGKTLAFLLPILSDISSSPKSERGLCAIIVSPTRELCIQLAEVTKKFSAGKRINVKNLCHFSLKDSQPERIGRLSKCDIIISTPARLCRVLKSGFSLGCLRYLVMDEGDKLLTKNFLDQLTVIIKDLPKNTSKSLFSATTNSFTEELAQYFLNDPVKVAVGRFNAPPKSVNHKLQFVGNEEGKILEISKMVRTGIKLPALIFAQSIQCANELFRELIYYGINVGLIHSDRTRAQRDQTVKNFREGKLWVLVTSELVSRGIDFRNVNLVINYDFPLTMESYLHRAGRTGRGGKGGDVITFFTQEDFPYVRGVAGALKASGNECVDWVSKIPKLRKKFAPKRRSGAVNTNDIINAANKRIKVSQQTSENNNGCEDATKG